MPKINRQNLTFFFCCVLMTALIYSKYVISLSMIALTIIGLFRIENGHYFWKKIKLQTRVIYSRFSGNRAYPVISLLFITVLLSGLWSEDMVYLTERLRIKLPFLVLPIAFAGLPVFSFRQYHSIYYFLLFLLFISCLGVGLNYLINFQEITGQISRGHPIPTPNNHIRFSLLLAFGILVGINLYRKGFYLKYSWEKNLILGITVFLFGFIHVLSVRSGLIALYLTIIFLVIREIINTRRYSYGLGMIVIIMVLPLAAYKAIPSLKAKIDYSLHDFNMYQKGGGVAYSDSERLISLAVGWKIFKDNPIIGVGAGDLKKEIEKEYKNEFYYIKTPKMPHNQFLSTLAGTGVLGGIVFLLVISFPLIYRRNYKSALFLSLHLIVFLSFMVENTIENSIGVAFYLFFLLLGINYLSIQNSSKP